MLSRSLVRFVANAGALKQQCRCTQCFSLKQFATQAESSENARPYSEMPGPTKFELIRYSMPGGIIAEKSVYELFDTLTRKYGNIYRLPGLFGKPDVVITNNPDDYEVMFRNEGPWPYRRNFDTVVYYREVYRRDYFDGVDGILSAQGETWAKTRKIVNPILMQPKNARLYLDTMQEVNDEFLARIREIRNPSTLEVPENFEDDINRLSLESVCAVALNKQLGLLRKNRDTAESKALLKSIRSVMDLAFHLDLLPIWKFISTPKFRQMMDTLDTLTNICKKYINEALVRVQHDDDGNVTSEVGKERSVLEKIARIDRKLAIVMALDLIIAGIDTTSTSLSGLLICIAKNPEKQNLLFEEIKQILPQKDSRLTMDNMQHMPYLRACIKEGLRMYPIIPGTMRRMPHDIVLSGYHIPRGTDVTNASNLQMRNEKFVPRAKEFLPERFLRQGGDSHISGEITNPFMYLPFGFGPRSCVGKRIVNLEMELTLARLVRNFKIEFNHPIDKAFSAKFIVVPSIPLQFRFEERNE